MKHSLISCIIPVYNGEQFLREAIDSVLAQSYRPIEVIVVDDGSTDGTASVARSYGHKVKYLWQVNSGPAVARNLGISTAKGEYIAFLDADDLWHPEKLSFQMSRFRARPDLDLCLTHVEAFITGKLLEKRGNFLKGDLVVVIAPYTTCSSLVHRRVIDRIGQFNPDLRLGEDTDWFLRLSNSGAVIEIIPQVMVYARLHESNMKENRNVLSRDELLARVKKSIDERRTGLKK
jgi:glycosyltransferase involved in cell wall biosynthesis